MRSSTIAGIALVAISTAAIAQVATTPIEQKTAPDNSSANGAASNAAIANDEAVGPAPTNTSAPTMGNDVAAPHPSETKPR